MTGPRFYIVQDDAIDPQGNPNIPVTGCPNCGRKHGPYAKARFLSVVGHAAIRNSGGQHPNDPCSRACRLQWEYAEHVHQQPEARRAR